MTKLKLKRASFPYTTILDNRKSLITELLFIR